MIKLLNQIIGKSGFAGWLEHIEELPKNLEHGDIKNALTNFFFMGVF